MTFNISMLAGAGWQFFDNSGVILSGGLLYTYAAGTTTPQTAYTSSSGSTAHTNPIVLDSAGRVPSGGEIWLIDGVSYKFVLKTSVGVTIGTYDNIFNINYFGTNPIGIKSINGGQIAGLRNRIINGYMQVDQRNSGASKTITGGIGYAGSAYTVDRWAAFSVGSTGATFTAQRTGSAPYSLSLTVTAINFGTTLGIYQRIESVNCTDLVNQSITISATISCDSAQTVTWIAYYPNVKDTWTGPGVSSSQSTNATQIATGTWSATTTPTRFNATFTNASSLNGLQIVIQRSINANSQTLVVTDAQLELGSTVTTFEQRPYGLELMLCQRYYYRTVPNFSGAYYGGGRTSSTSQGNITLRFPVRMRTVPSAIETTGTASDYQISYVASSTALTAVPVYASFVTTQDVASMNFTTAAVLTAGQPVDLQAGTTSAYLGWSAEL